MAYDKFPAVDSSTMLFPPAVRERLAGVSPNYIINGDFSINQRNFTSSTVSGSYVADRWFFNGSTTTTGSRQAFTPGAAPVAGYEGEAFARLVTSGQSGASVRTDLIQRIEDVRTIAGQTITVSFWAKAGSGTPSVSLEFAASYGTGGSPSAVETGIGVNKIVLTGGTSWTRYSATVTMPTLSGKTLGTTPNTSYWSMSLWVSAGTDYNSRTNSLGVQNNTFDFWGVQLETGSVATAFRRNANSIQGELAACQRYFAELCTGFGSPLAAGQAYSTTAAYGFLTWPVVMRTAPSVTYSSLTHFYVATATGTSTGSQINMTFPSTSARGGRFNFDVASGLSVGQAIILQNNTAAATLSVSAEL